nr:hypothetical protein Iba_chr11fCG6710 [Ipomoea batatas]
MLSSYLHLYSQSSTSVSKTALAFSLFLLLYFFKIPALFLPRPLHLCPPDDVNPTSSNGASAAIRTPGVFNLNSSPGKSLRINSTLMKIKLRSRAETDAPTSNKDYFNEYNSNPLTPAVLTVLGNSGILDFVAICLLSLVDGLHGMLLYCSVARVEYATKLAGKCGYDEIRLWTNLGLWCLLASRDLHSSKVSLDLDTAGAKVFLTTHYSFCLAVLLQFQFPAAIRGAIQISGFLESLLSIFLDSKNTAACGLFFRFLRHPTHQVHRLPKNVFETPGSFARRIFARAFDVPGGHYVRVNHGEGKLNRRLNHSNFESVCSNSNTSSVSTPGLWKVVKSFTLNCQKACYAEHKGQQDLPCLESDPRKLTLERSTLFRAHRPSGSMLVPEIPKLKGQCQFPSSAGYSPFKEFEIKSTPGKRRSTLPIGLWEFLPLILLVAKEQASANNLSIPQFSTGSVPFEAVYSQQKAPFKLGRIPPNSPMDTENQ